MAAGNASAVLPIDVLFSSAKRWAWQFSPPESSPLRNEPPLAGPAQDIAQAWRNWRTAIEANEASEMNREQTEPTWHTVRQASNGG